MTSRDHHLAAEDRMKRMSQRRQQTAMRSLAEDFRRLGLTGAPDRGKAMTQKTPLQALAEEVEAVDRDWAHIRNLRAELAHMAQMVHQAYHGASGPDADHGTWETCSRGICKRAGDVIDESFKYERSCGRSSPEGT
jgi:hypothetical protein